MVQDNFSENEKCELKLMIENKNLEKTAARKYSQNSPNSPSAISLNEILNKSKKAIETGQKLINCFEEFC